MKVEKVLKILDDAQARGARVAIELKEIDKPDFIEAEKLNEEGDFAKAACIYYSLYKKEETLDYRMKYGVALTQALINASNLDRAESILDELEKSSGDERFKGAIFEKRGWIADCRNDYDNEISYFSKAKDIYERLPESKEIEGHKDDRLLTVDHFIGRALYFRGRKSDLPECVNIFTKNLEGYRKLKKDSVVAFNYAWLARTYIAMADLEKAQECVDKAGEHFRLASTFFGERIIAHAYRVEAELAVAMGDDEQALRSSLEALRLTLPEGAYYGGVVEAIKSIVNTVSP